MVLLPHFLIGALIGSKTGVPILAFILSLLSHYILDLIPHIDYPIENIKKRQWREALPEIAISLTDLLSGVLIVAFFFPGQPIIFICGFLAVLPDGLTFLSCLFSKNRILKENQLIHEKTHFLKDNKKISLFWRIFSQALIVIIFLSSVN